MKRLKKKAQLRAIVEDLYERMKTTTLRYDRPIKSELHPTMKPVKLVRDLIATSSRPDQIVLDPFMGSGTTLIAAEQTGRQCYGLELAPAFCDVIVQRWEEFTGQKATR
jgi:DNA modification methylase